MERGVRRIFILAIGMVLTGLAGCDSAPNPAFVHDVKQGGHSSGDPYRALDWLPREYGYFQSETNLRGAWASQQALSLRARYTTLLETLDAEHKAAGAAQLLAQCRQSFADAVAYQADTQPQPKEAGSALFKRLTACRDQAVAVEKSGDEATARSAVLLRRFASVGMVLVGVATVAHGDETTGLALWRDGDELAVKDRPGFKITPDMFRQ